MHKDLRQLFRKLAREGYVVEKTNGGHMKITHPEIKRAVNDPSKPAIVFAQSSGNDKGRGVRNLKSELNKKFGWKE